VHSKICLQKLQTQRTSPLYALCRCCLLHVMSLSPSTTADAATAIAASSTTVHRRMTDDAALLSPPLDTDAAAIPHDATVPQGLPMMARTQPHTPAPLTPPLFTYKSTPSYCPFPPTTLPPS
jgi:hypothetical protein